MREELVEAVLRVVEAIPPGRVATYGMIARGGDRSTRCWADYARLGRWCPVVARRERSRNFSDNRTRSGHH